ncbi:MAG: ABC transporter substrate-binding protein [Opitutales bacterium]|nr:ABC transporter substrate-binding protein [Opitutales bacterium]
MKFHVVPCLWVLFIGIPCQAAERLVTLGGPVTEIIFALGAGDEVVAVDQSSLYPETATQLPQVGYVGALGAEGVLSLNPTLILASTRIGPPAVVKQLSQSGIPLRVVENPNSAESLRETIEALGSYLNRTEAAQSLWQRIDEDLHKTREAIDGRETPGVVFLLGNNGIPMAAGTDTQANGIVHLAGGRNLFSGYSSYKPVSEEALIQAQPDVILIASHGTGLERDPQTALRDLGLTQLARNATRIHLIDMGEYLSFGPRTGEAAYKLAQILHDAKASSSE